MAISSKKFNNKIDYQQRKQNKHQKKNVRTPMTEQKKLRKNKQKERDTKLRGDREWKEQDTTPYSRINLRKGKQLYSEFDAKYEHDLQYMGTAEYHELKIHERLEIEDWYDYMDYYDQLYQDFDDERERIRKCEQEDEQQERQDEENQRKKQRPLELEKKQSQGSENKTCSGACSVCRQPCNTNQKE